MKPSSEYDFPVGVSCDSLQRTGPARALYAGIYTVNLNHSVLIEFVPMFERYPWPPKPSGDIDDVRSHDEARRFTVATARYSVTPDDARKGTAEEFNSPSIAPPPHDQDSPCTVFYVGVAEFNEVARELVDLFERMAGIYDSVPISELKETTLAHILLKQFLPSGQLSARHLYMLGRGSAE